MFRNANLEGARFAGCKAANADFRGAILTDVYLEDSDFAGADLTGAIIDIALLDHPAMHNATKPMTEQEAGLDLPALLADHKVWVETNAASG